MEWRVFGHHPTIVLSGRRRSRQGRDKFGTVVVDVTHRNDELQKTSHTAEHEQLFWKQHLTYSVAEAHSCLELIPIVNL